MKVLALIALCAFAAVQARSTAVQNVRTEAALGENPWFVHLRIAVITSGLLKSCAGSLIREDYVLSSSSCLLNQRFIWIRYGVTNVINPSLVTENSAVRVDPENNVALILINRIVQSTDYISPVQLPSDTSLEAIPSSTKFCGFGDNGADGPGEKLRCFNIELETLEDGSISAISDEGAATEFDDGAPLVNEGVQYGVLVAPANEERAGKFLSIIPYLAWIEETIALNA